MTPEQKKKVRRIGRLIAELDRDGIRTETDTSRDITFYQDGYGYVADIIHHHTTGWNAEFVKTEEDTDDE